jgi:chromosome segregation ATPase
LADLGTLVDELREQLAEKRRDKAELQDENCRLRKELSDVKLERDRLRAQLDADPLRHYPYPIGVAEPGSKSQVGTGDAAAVPTPSDAL